LFTLDRLFNWGEQGRTDLGDLVIMDKLFPAEEIIQPVSAPAAPSLATQLSGRILLQVEENGEAWYVNPVDKKRYFLNGPNAAFSLMSNVAVGISNADFDAFQGKATPNLSGKFLLKVEDAGKLYYVNPVNRSLNFVGGPSGAQALIQDKGLGISNANLERIPEAN